MTIEDDNYQDVANLLRNLIAGLSPMSSHSAPKGGEGKHEKYNSRYGVHERREAREPDCDDLLQR